MYEYKFVEVKLRHGMFSTSVKEDYREIVKKHAADGWRLVQLFAPPFSFEGNASKFEIIFERKK